MKKVVVFGSTGMTGLCAVEAAINKGIQVRAFVRDPSKLPDELKSKVEVFQGDVLEPDSVFNAVDGTDGVIVALGTRGSLDPTSDMSQGTNNIIDAMRAKHVKNVSACISAFLFYGDDKVPPRFGPITKDHKRMYEALKESGLNWIAVFSPHIAGTEYYSRKLRSEGPIIVSTAFGDLSQGVDGNTTTFRLTVLDGTLRNLQDPSRDIIVEVNPEKSPGRCISKYDLGKFLVDSLTEEKYYKAVIGLCNVPQQ